MFGEGERPEEVPATYQFQVVQRSRELIDVFVVRDEPYTPDEETVVARYFQQTLGHPFKFAFHRVDAVPRSASGKFEDFISEAQ